MTDSTEEGENPNRRRFPEIGGIKAIHIIYEPGGWEGGRDKEAVPATGDIVQGMNAGADKMGS